MGDISAWWLVGATVFSSLLVGFFTHYLTKDRDIAARQAILNKEQDLRKHHFLGFLSRWKCQMYRQGDAEPYRFYHDTACEIAYEAGVIRADFKNGAAFDSLISTAMSFKRNEIEQDGQPPKREKIFHAIDAVIAFVESA